MRTVTFSNPKSHASPSHAFMCIIPLILTEDKKAERKRMQAKMMEKLEKRKQVMLFSVNFLR